jgi:hypothetical protein
VERQNEGFLNRLATEMRKYPAKDGSKYENSSHLDALQKNCPAPTMVTLRVGAQVRFYRLIRLFSTLSRESLVLGHLTVIECCFAFLRPIVGNFVEKPGRGR